MTNNVTIINAITKEVIEREATPEELSLQEALDIENKKNLQLSEDRQKARNSAFAKLAALGLTEEEIRAMSLPH
jgi:hypothetical protein